MIPLQSISWMPWCDEPARVDPDGRIPTRPSGLRYLLWRAVPGAASASPRSAMPAISALNDSIWVVRTTRCRFSSSPGPGGAGRWSCGFPVWIWIWRAMISRVRIRPSTRMVLPMAPMCVARQSARSPGPPRRPEGANTRKNAWPDGAQPVCGGLVGRDALTGWMPQSVECGEAAEEPRPKPQAALWSRCRCGSRRRGSRSRRRCRPGDPG